MISLNDLFLYELGWFLLFFSMMLYVLYKMLKPVFFVRAYKTFTSLWNASALLSARTPEERRKAFIAKKYATKTMRELAMLEKYDAYVATHQQKKRSWLGRLLHGTLEEEVVASIPREGLRTKKEQQKRIIVTDIVCIGTGLLTAACGVLFIVGYFLGWTIGLHSAGYSDLVFGVIFIAVSVVIIIWITPELRENWRKYKRKKKEVL